MSTGAALLQAILDDPDSDERRLVYADWLEEHDQADPPLPPSRWAIAHLPRHPPRLPALPL